MTKEEHLDWLYRLKSEIYTYMPIAWVKPMENALRVAIKALEQEPTTKNDLEVDCIDRQATLDAIIKRLGIKNETYLLEAERAIYQQILAMPSVTPQEPNIGHCKDCKWWKDSDGEYRRGCRAESKCPINRKEVYEGNGYCYLYEPQEREVKE